METIQSIAAISARAVQNVELAATLFGEDE
jgi:hypothetical protein